MSLELFLDEYKKLCEKYKIMISGCGCCNSPFCVPIEYKNIDTNLDEHIEHLQKEGLI